MTASDQLLRAGALLPAKGKLRGDVVVDDVSARSYRHPALEHPAVKLSSDNLAAGDDLTMEFLGFTSPDVAGPIARRQRRALGFPEWALINDPDHARHALELVKEFRREVNRAKAKPGHAQEGFETIAKRLGKSVAHFLPSFWEQVGREFIQLGNTTYGSRAFSKAREAEKVHGLEINEDVRRDAFLEFALAGCVSIKVLTEYGKELTQRHDPLDAWQFFRELCVRRVLGGMPPWTAMLKDMTRLIKQVDLDVEAELESVLQEIVAAPSINRASLKFWSSTTSVIVPLAQRNPQVAGALLNLIPKTTSWRGGEFYEWCQLLDDWGILENAWSHDIDPAAAPKGGAAAWYTRGLRSAWRSPQFAYDLLERMAPRLRKDRVPLDLCRSSWRVADAEPDLLDLALSLKLRLADPPDDHTVVMDLDGWCREGLLPLEGSQDVSAETPRPGRLRDLSWLAADQRFASALQKAVADSMGSEQFERHAQGKAGLTEARRQCLLSWLAELTEGTLLSFEESLERLQTSTSATTFEEFPEAYRRLKDVDVIDALTATLRAGVIDEYGWPALEDVAERLTGEDGNGQPAPPLIAGNFPYLIVTDRLTAVVLRGDEVVLQAELQIPPGHMLESMKFLDGDLVIWADRNHQTKAWWHSQPAAVSEGWFFGKMDCRGLAFDLPDGGTFVGSEVIHRGQTSLLDVSLASQILHADGRFWKYVWHEPENSGFEEVDPSTGKQGRAGLPGWLEEFLKPGWELAADSVSLADYGALVDASPLGSRSGRVGLRARRKSEADVPHTQYEGIDGRAFEHKGSTCECIVALLQQPGSKDYLPVDDEGDVWDPTGRHRIGRLSSGEPLTRGQAAALSVDFLHLTSIRDLTSSRVLRKVTRKRVAPLLQAARQDADDWGRRGLPPEEGGYPALDREIRNLLPQLESERLLRGIRGVVIFAARQQQSVEKLIAKRNPERVAPPPSASAAERLAEKAMASFRLRGVEDCQGALFGHLADAGAFFTGDNDEPHASWACFGVITRMLTLRPEELWMLLFTEKFKREWLPVLHAWLELPFSKLPGQFRSYDLEAESGCPLRRLFADPPDDEFCEDDLQSYKVLGAYTQKENRYLLRRTDSTSFEVLEYAPSGRFHSIESAKLRYESRVVGLPDGQLDVLHKLVAAAGRPIVLPEPILVDQVSEATGLGSAQIVNLWLGCPSRKLYRSDWASKEIRSRYNLRVKDVKSAGDQAGEFENEFVEQILQALLSEPEDLWTDHLRVASRFAAAWEAHKPKRLVLSEELHKEISLCCPFGLESGTFQRALVDPLSDMLFDDSVKYTLREVGAGDFMLVTDPADCEVFSEAVLEAAASTTALLFYRLPVGDPARDCVASLTEATLRAIGNPDLLLLLAHVDPNTSDDKVLSQMKAAFGEPKKVCGDQDSVWSLFDDGFAVGELEETSVTLRFRPAKLKTARQMEKLRNQVGTFFDSPEVAHRALSGLNAVEIVRRKSFGEMAKRVHKTPVPEGHYEANPLLAAAALVKSVAKQLTLSEDAAAYYLQILSLPDPTDRNVKLWNGWSTAQVKAVAKELVAAELVIAAKRSRAGRSVFLPGGWEALKSPLPPLETWKMPLFGMTRDHYGRAAPPLSLILPLEPLHLLFARAWERVQSGDAPQYESVNGES